MNWRGKLVFMPYMVPNPDSEAGGLVKHPMYDGPGGKDLEASHVFASERNKMHYRGLQQRQSQSPQRFVEDGTHGMWLGNLPDALSTVDWGNLGMWAGGFAGGVGVTKMRQDIKERRAAKHQEETTISGYPRSTPE